jgi:hypothetical protein
MNFQELENLIENNDDVDMTDKDYGIIIGPDGKLKMLVLPDEIDHSDEVPDIVAQIISMFDQDSINQSSRVIH